MKWICLIRWKAEMIDDSWGRVFSSSSPRKTCICFFFFFGGGLSANFTFNPQTVLEMMVVFFSATVLSDLLNKNKWSRKAWRSLPKSKIASQSRCREHCVWESQQFEITTKHGFQHFWGTVAKGSRQNPNQQVAFSGALFSTKNPHEINRLWHLSSEKKTEIICSIYICRGLYIHYPAIQGL